MSKCCVGNLPALEVGGPASLEAFVWIPRLRPVEYE